MTGSDSVRSTGARGSPRSLRPPEGGGEGGGPGGKLGRSAVDGKLGLAVFFLISASWLGFVVLGGTFLWPLVHVFSLLGFQAASDGSSEALLGSFRSVSKASGRHFGGQKPSKTIEKPRLFVHF